MGPRTSTDSVTAQGADRIRKAGRVTIRPLWRGSAPSATRLAYTAPAVRHSERQSPEESDELHREVSTGRIA